MQSQSFVELNLVQESIQRAITISAQCIVHCVLSIHTIVRSNNINSARRVQSTVYNGIYNVENMKRLDPVRSVPKQDAITDRKHCGLGCTGALILGLL